jgi:hypothetical protein
VGEYVSDPRPVAALPAFAGAAVEQPEEHAERDGGEDQAETETETEKKGSHASRE